MVKLTSEETLKLGKSCECNRCGNEGVYMIEPYAQEIFNEEYLTCLCGECEIDSVMST